MTSEMPVVLWFAHDLIFFPSSLVFTFESSQSDAAHTTTFSPGCWRNHVKTLERDFTFENLDKVGENTIGEVMLRRNGPPL